MYTLESMEGLSTQDRFLAVIGGLSREREEEMASVASQSVQLESADSEQTLESIANRTIAGSFKGGEASLLAKPERSALAFIALFGAVALGIWSFTEVTSSTAPETRELWFMGLAVAMFLFFSFLMAYGFKTVAMSIKSGDDDSGDDSGDNNGGDAP